MVEKQKNLQKAAECLFNIGIHKELIKAHKKDIDYPFFHSVIPVLKNNIKKSEKYISDLEVEYNNLLKSSLIK